MGTGHHAVLEKVFPLEGLVDVLVGMTTSRAQFLLQEPTAVMEKGTTFASSGRTGWRGS
jgi:hypothetical protein